MRTVKRIIFSFFLSICFMTQTGYAESLKDLQQHLNAKPVESSGFQQWIQKNAPQLDSLWQRILDIQAEWSRKGEDWVEGLKSRFDFSGKKPSYKGEEIDLQDPRARERLVKAAKEDPEIQKLTKKVKESALYKKHLGKFEESEKRTQDFLADMKRKLN